LTYKKIPQIQKIYKKIKLLPENVNDQNREIILIQIGLTWNFPHKEMKIENTLDYLFGNLLLIIFKIYV